MRYFQLPVALLVLLALSGASVALAAPAESELNALKQKIDDKTVFLDDLAEQGVQNPFYDLQDRQVPAPPQNEGVNPNTPTAAYNPHNQADQNQH